MYFDDYSTSLQSLYAPMYNMQTNVTATANGANGSAGVNGSAAANRLNYASMYGYTPMANVGVGQFGADQLVKNDETQNNYYARPIAPHKKKDDVPMMLGIAGTALGTAALILAMWKGRGKATPIPRPTPTPNPTPVPTPTPTPVPTPTPTPIPTPVPTPTPTLDPSRLLPAPSGNVNVPAVIPGGNQGVHITIPQGRQALPGRTSIFGDLGEYVPFEEIPNNSLTNIATGRIGYNNPIAGLLPAPTQSLPVLANGNTTLKPISEYLPGQGSTFNIPGAVKGFLPAPTATTQGAQQAVQQTATTGDFIRPVITRKNNRFANINGTMVQNRLSTIGLQVDQKAFSKLPSALHREFNNVVLNGTDAQLKAITCDPRYEHIFSLI